ncbi:MAG: CDP-alcohol phosphatidyltransferase family protein [Phycisphaerales bacterium]
MAILFFIVLTLWRWEDSAASRHQVDWVLISAAAMFIIACITDVADGYLARKWKVESAFGRIMDPFADKILVVGAFVFLAGPDFWWEFPAGSPSRLSGHGIQISGVYPWMAVVILGRELLVTSIRGVLEGQGIKFGADWWGKWKMILQSIAIPTALITPAVTRVLPPRTPMRSTTGSRPRGAASSSTSLSGP